MPRPPRRGAAGVVDEEQHVDPLEERGGGVEQITCPAPRGLGFQELAPGRAVAPTDPGPCELAADPLVSPGGVLAGGAQHCGADVCPGGGAPWTFPRIGPRAGDHVTVPPPEPII